MMNQIKLNSVWKIYRGRTEEEVWALRDVTALIKGPVAAIIGPSGSGKTTLLNLIGAIDRPTRGEIIYNSMFIDFENERSLREYRSRYVSFIWQKENLISSLSILENIALPLLCNGVKYKQAIKRAIVAFEKVGLSDDKLKRLPHQLSGGEKQRVAIARAFCSEEAPLILADEPTASLDASTARYIMRDLRALVLEHQKLLIWVTHHEDLAMQFSDEIFYLKEGRLHKLESISATDPTGGSQ